MTFSDFINKTDGYLKSCRILEDYVSFDFYLPEHNICIEYDGQQHYRPVNKFGGEPQFKIGQKNDNIKSQYCIPVVSLV